jgi:hypothetical protein
MTVDTHSLNIANDQAVLERFKLNPGFGLCISAGLFILKVLKIKIKLM